MARLPLATLLFLAGCATTPQASVGPPVSAVRVSLLQQVEPLLAKSLTAEGFTVGQSEVTANSAAARNTGEAWDANTVTVVFDGTRDPSRPDVEMQALTTPQQAAVLGNFSSALRKIVTGQDGVVVSSSVVENYHEQTLTTVYTLPGVVGSVQAKLSPASDAAEETRNRFEVVIREQPGR
jgi:hypothetical protein